MTSSLRAKGIAGAFLAIAAIGSADVGFAADAHSPALALAALDRKIADFDAEEESSKAELSGLSGRIHEAHEKTLVHGRYFYRLTRAGMLPLGGGFRDLVGHAMRFERARRSLESDLAAENKLRARGAELATSLERIVKDRVALASQRSAMDSARVAMYEEQRRQKAFDEAFDHTNGGSEFVAVRGGGPSDSNAGGFESSRGRMLFPVIGRADVRPAHHEGIDSAGIEVHTTMGASVRAIYSGRVAFADRYGSYGRIVIIDHGDHYYSVSGNLANVLVRVGDEISAGETIGSVGDGGQGPLLYFEIRHGSETISPKPWLGL